MDRRDVGNCRIWCPICGSIVKVFVSESHRFGLSTVSVPSACCHILAQCRRHAGNGYICRFRNDVLTIFYIRYGCVR